ncbi:MAG: hypothetical protein ACRDKS_14690 [Actinomycetota bacterium]
MTDDEMRRTPENPPRKRRVQQGEDEDDYDRVVTGPDASLRLLAKALVATARAILEQEAEQK